MSNLFLKFIICYIAILPLANSLSAKEVLVDKIIAVVNDEIKTLSDLKEYKKSLKARKAQISPKEYKAFMTSNKKLLDNLINDVLISQYIKEKKAEPTEQDIQNALNRILKQFGMSKADFEKRLKYEGLTMEQFKREKKRDLEIARFFEFELKRRIAISETDLEQQFTKKFKESVHLSEYNIHHILFSNANKATKIKDKILAGASFSEMAYKHSTDSGTKAQGGNLGFLQSEDLILELRKVVKNMTPNDVKGPVKTALGYHIIKLVGLRNIPNPKFTASKNKVKMQLIDVESKKQLKLWTIRRRDESYVKIFL